MFCRNIIRYYDSLQSHCPSSSSALLIVRRGIMLDRKSTFVSLEMHFWSSCRHLHPSPPLSWSSHLHLQGLALGNSTGGSAASVAGHVCSVDALVVLDSVLLDAFPHLFDAEVELVLRLLLLVDKVVGVVGRLVRLAARLRRGCCGDGRWG